MSVPSLVSICRRGPLSGSADVDGISTGRDAAVLRPERLLPVGVLASDSRLLGGVVFAASLSDADSSFRSAAGSFAGGRVLLGAGVRPLAVLDLGLGTVTSRAGFFTGSGSGVGATATSSEGGSSILAPTDETRLPVLPDLVPAPWVSPVSASVASA